MNVTAFHQRARNRLCVQTCAQTGGSRAAADQHGACRSARFGAIRLVRSRSKERASSRAAVLHSANCGTCAPPRRTQAFIDACALLSPRNLRILCRPAGPREATFSGGLRGFSAFSYELLILSASAFECVCFCRRRC